MFYSNIKLLLMDLLFFMHILKEKNSIQVLFFHFCVFGGLAAETNYVIYSKLNRHIFSFEKHYWIINL
jgi:hypothetical protein